MSPQSPSNFKHAVSGRQRHSSSLLTSSPIGNAARAATAASCFSHASLFLFLCAARNAARLDFKQIRVFAVI
jgi:hypothetical protein